MADQKFDIIIVGGGPGGYVTAIRAAQLGMRTALVEANHLGGICLNWGCIPTKALLRSAEIYRNIKHANEYGIKVDNVTFDLADIVKRSRGVAAKLSGGVAHLLKKNKVTVFDGWGKLAGVSGARQITVEKDNKLIATLSAKHIILATGARARQLPGLEADGKLVWTYREALVPKEMPKSLLVIGSGAIGIEFASFFNEFGAKTTVVEVMDRVLPVEDEEISKLAHKAFTKQGINIMAKAAVKSLKHNDNDVCVTIEQDGKLSEITVDRVISAVGIVGNVENIGLEGTKVKVDRAHVEINQWCETGEAGVYAIGDLTGPPWLAHKAEHEGVICVEKIAGLKNTHPLDLSRIPGCTYCHPQIASIGLTEAGAKEKGYKIKVGRFPFMANGKAVALGEDEGMVKVIFNEKTGELLGAHMIGAEVTELIQGYSIAKTLETTEEDLMHTVFPHPTLSEMMHEAVLDAYGKAIHM